jgi:Ca2+-binding EF-hand superfamily protein
MTWNKVLGGFGLAGLMAGAAGAQVPQPAQPIQPAQRPVAVQPGQPAQRPAAVQPGQPQAGARAPVQGQAVTPSPTQISRQLQQMPQLIDSPQDVRDALRMAFMVVDADGNGLISQEEATNAANMAVGGIFFAADADGNGSVTQEEARAVRQWVVERQPALKILIQRVRQNQDGDSQANPLRGVANLLDADNDKELAATEVRDTVKTAVQAAFAAGDTNRDGQMSPDELNAAAIGLAQAAGEAVFSLADADNNGKLSQEEFKKALEEPTNAIFTVLDADGDGQISAEEAQEARQFIMTRMVPTIPRARGGAPIPDINVNRTGGQDATSNR